MNLRNKLCEECQKYIAPHRTGRRMIAGWDHPHDQILPTFEGHLCIVCGMMRDERASGEGGDPKEWYIPAVDCVLTCLTQFVFHECSADGIHVSSREPHRKAALRLLAEYGVLELSENENRVVGRLK